MSYEGYEYTGRIKTGLKAEFQKGAYTAWLTEQDLKDPECQATGIDQARLDLSEALG